MTKDEAIKFLTTDPDTGEDTEWLSVPCSRYGRKGGDCARVTWDATVAYCDVTGDEMTTELLDYIMGLVVNDHDDIAHLLAIFDPCGEDEGDE